MNNEKGAQKQTVKADSTKLYPETVQGVLEVCTKRFKSIREPRVCISSRTDAGVHALRSSAHVDLERASGLQYDPLRLTVAYNKYFTKANLELRVQSVHIVPETFHARGSVKSRTYLYRLAVRKPDAPPLCNRISYRAEIPIIECNRCHFIQKADEFDVPRMKAAAALFPGTKDFSTFMGRRSKRTPDINIIKEMYSLHITPGTPLLGAECSSSSYYTFWNITCHAKSFLYRQVRRMVGALISVAEGYVTVEDVRYMLENPSDHSWNKRITVVPPYGLYLVDVEYDPLEMAMSQETVQQDHANKTILCDQVE